jgi:hypothetical protein
MLRKVKGSEHEHEDCRSGRCAGCADEEYNAEYRSMVVNRRNKRRKVKKSYERNQRKLKERHNRHVGINRHGNYKKVHLAFSNFIEKFTRELETEAREPVFNSQNLST